MAKRTAKESTSADQDASGAALEASRQRLHDFLTRRLGRGSHDARDLLQEVYVRFLQTPDHELIRQPMAYLYRIATNLLYDRHQRASRDTVIYDSETAEERLEHPAGIWRDEVTEPLGAQQELDTLLGRLPAIYRAVLLLHKRDGLSSLEIAESLRISRHTAEKYLYRAIAYFRRVHEDRGRRS